MQKLVPFLLIALLVSCQTAPPRSPASLTRQSSARDKGDDEVAVYLDRQQVKYIQAPLRTYAIRAVGDTDVTPLQTWLVQNHRFFDVVDATPFAVHISDVFQHDGFTSVHFQQGILRQVDGQPYWLPIVGATGLVNLKNGRVQSVTSTFKNPPSVAMVAQHPGFDTGAFSTKQMTTLVNYIRQSPDEAKIRAYLATIAANSQIDFNFDKFLSLTPAKQLQSMHIFFSKIKAISTAKILIELAMQQKLALIQHGSEWMFQVTEFLGLPIEFDIVIPSMNDRAQRLRVRNLRDLHRTVTIQVTSQPGYPGGARDPRVTWDDQKLSPQTTASAQLSDVETAQLFYNVVQYFRAGFAWIGFNGKDESTTLNVVKDIATPPWNENAFWYRQGGFLGIGAGGDALSGLSGSVSVLAHEYTHAIIDNSSRLAYQGQSGALNEHIADIEGISAEAFIRQKPFDYTIGEDILTPATRDPQKDVIAAILKDSSYSTADIEKYSLNQVALRNIYLPKVSIFQQLGTMAEVNARYPSNCEPSVDNDSCGVHYAAGVPSRAAAMIIGALGYERTRKIFFNTAVFRLPADASFQEYVRQLNEECLLTSGLDPQKDCPVIAASFAKVGVSYPLDQNVKPTPPTPSPSSPPQSFCGHLTVTTMNNSVLIDNTHDALIVLAGNANRFGGHSTQAAPEQFSLAHKTQCACIQGSIDQIQNDKGTWVNYFSQIVPPGITTQPEENCAALHLE